MTMTAEEIFEPVRALAPRERLELVERILHDVLAEQAQNGGDAAEQLPSVDVTDEEHEALLAAVRDARRMQPLRSNG